MTKRGDATRDKILAVATEIFEEGGLRALRVSRVCERANISPTSLYWHFGNKAGLIQEVLESAFRPVGASLQQANDKTGFLRGLHRLVTQQPAGSLTMLGYVADNLADPDLEAALKNIRTKELRQQTDIIADVLGVAEEDAKRIGILINAAVNYAALVKMSGGSARESREVIDALACVID